MIFGAQSLSSDAKDTQSTLEGHSSIEHTCTESGLGAEVVLDVKAEKNKKKIQK